MIVLVPTAREFEAIFGTTLGDWSELDRVRLGRYEVTAGLCGFGLAAAGVLTSKWIMTLKPQELIVCGVAGTYDPEAVPIGHLLCADQVWSYGIGARKSRGFEQPSAMGFPQSMGGDPRETVYEVIELGPVRSPECAVRGGLVSVACAAAEHDRAKLRTEHCPGAVAEDMETFAAALAAHVHKVPLISLRGISNVAGERDKKLWRFHDAIESVRDGLLDLLEGRALLSP